MEYKKIIVKIGTHVLTKDNGLLNNQVIENLVKQIAQLKKQGVQVVLVSSGAMGAGQSLVKVADGAGDIVKRQILASVGQVNLMGMYVNEFKQHGYTCGQILATKEDFRDRKHYLNMKNCFEALLGENIVPIVNENDVVSVDELMFTDNDELAGLIASMLNAQALIILTTVDGVLDKNEQVISVIKTDADIEQYVSPGISKMGRGGMLTKCRVAHKVAALGVVTHIANGNVQTALLDIVEGKEIGTLFPFEGKASNVKKWIAHTQGQEKGVVYVNKCAEEVLVAKDSATSLLPVGITKIEGEFEKGDIIKIKGEKENDIGFGRAQYDSSKAKEYLGQQGKQELIHYDYLYLI